VRASLASGLLAPYHTLLGWLRCGASDRVKQAAAFAREGKRPAGIRAAELKSSVPVLTVPVREVCEGEITSMSTDSVLGRGVRPIGRLLLLAVLWIIVVDAEPSSWVVGVPTVGFATWVSLKLSARRETCQQPGLSLIGLMRFLPYFAVESLRGGIDVASRVMRPRLNIEPGFQRYVPRLSNPKALVIFLDSISLLPGTLSADLRGGIIEVHALDNRSDLTPELYRLERLVAGIFGETLAETAA